MTTEIRLADEHDEFEIFKLCSMMHSEQPYHPLEWDRVVPMVRLATSRTRGIIGVIGERHDLKAAIFLLLDQIWYSNDWQLLEFFNYVRPEARRSSYARDLIKYAKTCADSLNVDLTVGVFSNIRTDQKCRLYGRLIPKMGEFFSYSPPGRVAQKEAAFRELSAQEPANLIAAE
jgi:GNAT superfamily N-acetyltransferase